MTAEDLIKKYEGLSLNSYRCAAGVWTIGYGHTRTAGPMQKITKEQAEELLKSDIEIVQALIRKMVKVKLNESQMAALTSFVFNVGAGNFKNSTLLKKLNAGDYKGAAQEFMKWTKARNPKTGKMEELPGLVKRRKEEMELFLK